MDYSPIGSSVHGIFQAGILEWVAMPSSKESSQPRNRTHVSCIEGGFFYCLSHLSTFTVLEIKMFTVLKMSTTALNQAANSNIFLRF